MLENIKLLSTLSETDLSTLSLFCQERVLNPWEVLFEEWDEANSMYILVSWLLEAYSWKEVLWKIHPQEIVWEMAIFEGSKKRMASVRALEETYLIVFPWFSIENLSKKHPKIMKVIKEVIIKRRKQNKGIN